MIQGSNMQGEDCQVKKVVGKEAGGPGGNSLFF